MFVIAISIQHLIIRCVCLSTLILDFICTNNAAENMFSHIDFYVPKSLAVLIINLIKIYAFVMHFISCKQICKNAKFLS